MDHLPSLRHSPESSATLSRLAKAESHAATRAEERDLATATLGWERLVRRRLSEDVAGLTTRLQSALADAERAREAARHSADEAAALRRHIQEIRVSTAWRLMGPWRVFGRAVRHLPGALRRRVSTAANPTRRNDSSAAPNGPRIEALSASLSDYSAQPIHFPAVLQPVVSVVIPCYKARGELEACLRSLAATLDSEPPFEVILVDDGPDAPVTPAIPASPGLMAVSNIANLGFLHTCNRGASLARGRYLCFLNTDTIVSIGWLRALVEAIEEVPGAGIVGGMLLGRDGRIQEAGWAILGNGWGVPVGRDADPDDGAFTYRRQVDCVTGACFLVARDTFAALGGLDPLYAPAFYEEFDLAFRVMAKGLSVIYEPRSRVIHLGSTSYGVARRDELSIINHKKFVARFADALSRRPWDGSDPYMLRGMPADGPIVLVAEDHLPLPDQSAGDVTISRYLMLLATAGWRVVFGSLDGQAEGPPAAVLERLGIELIRRPDTVKQWLERHGRHVHHVLLARPHVAEELLAAVRAQTTASVVYYTHDLHHVRLERAAAVCGNAARATEAANVKAREVKIFAAVDHVLSPSAAERDVVAQIAPGRTVTVLPPFFYDTHELCARDAAHFAPLRDVVFVGGYVHEPNADAARFIATDVMPIVWQSEPDARLILVGHAPPDTILALAGPRVVVTGSVPSVEPFLDKARVFLAALRFGAGVKGKTVQALQLGVPVVATSIGVEGIGIVPGRDAVVADDTETLAACVVALLNDPARCAALSQAGADLVRRHFSRGAARSAVDRVLNSPRCAVCGAGPIPDRHPSVNVWAADAPMHLVCAACRATAPIEALARVICVRLGSNGEGSLAEVARARGDVRVHLHGAGPIAEALRGWSAFSFGAYRASGTHAWPGGDATPLELLDQMGHRDDSLDVFITQGALDCRSDNEMAIGEIHRVLRRGGTWIFSDASESVRTTAEVLGFMLSVHDVAAPDASMTCRVFEALKPEG